VYRARADKVGSQLVDTAGSRVADTDMVPADAAVVDRLSVTAVALRDLGVARGGAVLRQQAFGAMYCRNSSTLRIYLTVPVVRERHCIA
jgi:hypothetical protein